MRHVSPEAQCMPSRGAGSPTGRVGGFRQAEARTPRGCEPPCRTGGSLALVALVAIAGLLVARPVVAVSATAIAAGQWHACALTSGGGVYCWGSNDSGQLGDGTTTQRLTPVAVSGLPSGVVSIAAGQYHTCVLTSGGAVWCWGSNGWGQLGDGTMTNRSTPVPVSGLSSGVVAIATGGSHTCAVNTFGGLQCWGYNYFGQLGDGTADTRYTPVTVTGMARGVASVSAGFYHTCAVRSAGAAECWGHNIWGALGDGTTTDRSLPTPVTGLSSGIASMSAGEYHSCAVTSAGNVRCWGWNGFYQLGDGTATNRLTPVAVSGTGYAAAVRLGDVHTCALTTGGAVRCWGSNAWGQIGDGTNTSRPTPTATPGLGSGVASLATGAGHTCGAQGGNGAVVCWGLNFVGELGDSTTTNRNVPTPTVALQPALADAGRDGRSDVVWHHATGGNVWLWQMSGTVPLSQSHLGTVADTEWLIHGLGDQTGDGRADLLWRHGTTGALFLWSMDGATVTAQTYLGAVVQDYSIAGTADYTGDGRTDILWRHQATGDVWLWQMNGTTLASVDRVATISPAFEIVASGDLNGDGKADLLWRNASSGDVWAWLMNGAVTTSQVYLGTVADLGYHVAGLADFNRDGRADVLWHHATSGDVWVWRMDGTTIATIAHMATVGDTSFRVASLGDYDGDGTADVLWQHATSGAVWAWLMNGGAIGSVTWVATVPDVGYQVVKPQ